MIVDKIYIDGLNREITVLQIALKHLVEVVEAHELESLSCDRDGQLFCECLTDAVTEAKEALAN